MPYVLRKLDGKRKTSPFLFTKRDVENLADDREHCYTLLSPVTMRTIEVGGKCRPKRTRR